MQSCRWKALLSLVLLAFYTVNSAAVNFSQCFTDVISCAKNASNDACASLNISNATAFSLLRTSKGAIPSTTDGATALSYPGCTKYCGRGEGPFSWTVFSQQYAQWLLPYLALLSQLPFGAPRRTDNLMSVILTLGSQTLTGYSLYMTLLNTRWVNEQLFSGINYPSVTVHQSIVRALCSLQQVPLRIHSGSSARFESLVVHPDNDDWWNTLAVELDYSHTWSISSATSITWVVVAYLLTVADSLSNVARNMQSSGQGTGSVWLWLLPIVVGWLLLSPKCDDKRVNDAYHKANKQVFVADSQDPPAAPTQVTVNFGLTISPSPGWKLHHRNITSPDESRIPPVFNYARTLPWSRTVYVISLFYRAAWRKSNRRLAVNGQQIPGSTRNNVPRESRLGNREQIIQYCKPDRYEYPGVDVLWPRGVLFNMIVASFMSLLLQWGTTFAAVLAAWFTPTVGLGCRSLAYVIYGMTSTVVWILLLLSSVLSYYAYHLVDDPATPDLERDEQHPQTPSILASSGFRGSIAIPLEEIQFLDINAEQVPLNTDEPSSISTIKYPRTGRKRALFIARVANWLRWIGKFLAIVNAIGLIANSIFQFVGVYDNCYCDSSVHKRGSSAFSVIIPNQGDISLARSAWIGAFALGFACCAIFVGTIYLIRDSLPS